MTDIEVKTDIQARAQETANKPAPRNILLLVLVTMIWGGTFLIVKDTVKISGPFTFLAFSCSVGTLVLAIIFRKRLLHITRAEIFAGWLIGIFLFAGYALQTTDLQYTTLSLFAWIGCIFILLGMIVGGIRLSSFKVHKRQPATENDYCSLRSAIAATCCASRRSASRSSGG
ncbi:MAG: hypothetical protein ACR2H5_02925 [Ktedonobacteraceae bacterium]